MKKILFSFIPIIMIAYSGIANAEFYVIGKPLSNPDLIKNSTKDINVYKDKHPNPKKERLFFVENTGSSTGLKHNVTGFSSETNIKDLFVKIKPKGWRLDCRLSICDLNIIKWRASSPVSWIKIMKGALKVLKPYGVEYKIDNDSKIISVYRPDDFSKSWVLDGKLSLKENIILWGKDSGYTVIWDSSNDWNTGMTQVIKGTFEDAAGKVIKAFNEKGINIDIVFNKGLHIIQVLDGNSMYKMTSHNVFKKSKQGKDKK